MADPIPLFEIAYDETEILNAVQSISRGSYWAKGPFVDSFEAELESYFGVDHAVVVNSGTTALVAALRALGVSPDDEVIVPSFTFIATANAVRLVGAEPVFVDIEEETFGLDPASVRESVTDRTAAIVPVHLYGGPCQIDELAAIAEEEGVALVEDAAEAFGATHEGKFAGTFGDAGILSFCQNKVVVTGEGGAVLTDDDDVASELRLYRSHGRMEGDYFESVGSGEYVSLGTNVRMSDLTAAIGCAQMEKVDDLIGGRRAAADAMTDDIESIEGVKPPRAIDGGRHVYQLYTIELEADVDRETVVESLDDADVSSKIYWDTPVHRTQYYRDTVASPACLPTTDAVADRVLSLPIYPDLTPAQANRITNAVAAGIKASR